MKKIIKKTPNSLIDNTINIAYINDRIDKEICEDTINKLDDVNLLDEYKKCKSVQNKIKKFMLVLEKHNIETDVRETILNDWLLELIPAGVKVTIRGCIFTSIVKNHIMNLT